PPNATEWRRNNTPRTRLVSGPTNVISACAPGELLSLLKPDTAPNIQRVMTSTRTPRRVATTECASSCASREARYTKAEITPAVQYALEVRPGAAAGRMPVARLQAIRAPMTNKLQFSPTWMPAMRPRLTFSFMSPFSIRLAEPELVRPNWGCGNPKAAEAHIPSLSTTCRTSKIPPSKGARFSHSGAWSSERTSHSQYPPTSSLLSANGPSMTLRCLPSNRTRLPCELGERRPLPTTIPAFANASLNFWNAAI